MVQMESIYSYAKLWKTTLSLSILGNLPFCFRQYRINWIKRAFYIKNLISSPHQHIRAN